MLRGRFDNTFFDFRCYVAGFHSCGGMVDHFDGEELSPHRANEGVQGFSLVEGMIAACS